MRTALRKVRPQIAVGLALTVLFSAIVFMLEIQELSAAREAAADEQLQKIEERLTLANSEMDAASAFVVQANPAVLMFDDFLGRLALSGKRGTPWVWAKLTDGQGSAALQTELRLQLGDPDFAIDTSLGTPLLAPVVMTFGDASGLKIGQDLQAVSVIRQALDGASDLAMVKARTLLLGADDGGHLPANSIFIVRLLVHDEQAPGRMRDPNLIMRGIELDTLRRTGGLTPRQRLQLADVSVGATPQILLGAAAPEQPDDWLIEDTAELAGRKVLIRIEGEPLAQWPRLWLLALVAGLLATGMYATYRSGLLIRAEATSLNKALNSTERELAETQRREQAFFENSGTANCETDYATGKLLRVNDSFCQAFGYTREELIGKTFTEITHPDDIRLSKTSLVDEHGKPRSVVQFEKRYLRKDGSVMWSLVNGRLYKSNAGIPLAYSTVIVDISGRKRDEEVKAMLLRELAHRVRNTVQLTASLARQTARTARSVSDYDTKFHKRLAALTAAQDILFDTGWKAAPLAQLAENTLKPFLPDRQKPDQIKISLPPVDLPTQQAQTLAIAIHELASNSAQYGAFAHGGALSFTGEIRSTDDGGERKLYLRWSETLDRRVRKPRKMGFGMTMLKTAMPEQFQGTSKITWQKDGLLYEAWLALPQTA